MMDFKWWYVSEPILIASENEGAPVGRIYFNSTGLTGISNELRNTINSCMANLLPAWEPPLITLKAGTGILMFLFPEIWAM
jgi:hypothetical protein